LREDTIGPWSRDKLNLLGKYLQAYVTIFKNQEWCRGYYYIDAFACSVKLRLRDADAQEYIDGSPLVALKLDPPFSGYFFVEISPWRVERLQELVRTYSDSKVGLKKSLIVSLNRLSCEIPARLLFTAYSMLDIIQQVRKSPTTYSRDMNTSVHNC